MDLYREPYWLPRRGPGNLAFLLPNKTLMGTERHRYLGLSRTGLPRGGPGGLTFHWREQTALLAPWPSWPPGPSWPSGPQSVVQELQPDAAPATRLYQHWTSRKVPGRPQIPREGPDTRTDMEAINGHLMAPLIGSGLGMGHCGASHRTPKGLHGPGPVSSSMAKTRSKSSELQPGIWATLCTSKVTNGVMVRPHRILGTSPKLASARTTCFDRLIDAGQPASQPGSHLPGRPDSHLPGRPDSHRPGWPASYPAGQPAGRGWPGPCPHHGKNISYSSKQVMHIEYCRYVWVNFYA